MLILNDENVGSFILIIFAVVVTFLSLFYAMYVFVFVPYCLEEEEDDDSIFVPRLSTVEEEESVTSSSSHPVLPVFDEDIPVKDRIEMVRVSLELNRHRRQSRGGGGGGGVSEGGGGGGGEYDDDDDEEEATAAASGGGGYCPDSFDSGHVNRVSSIQELEDQMNTLVRNSVEQKWRAASRFEKDRHSVSVASAALYPTIPESMSGELLSEKDLEWQHGSQGHLLLVDSPPPPAPEGGEAAPRTSPGRPQGGMGSGPGGMGMSTHSAQSEHMNQSVRGGGESVYQSAYAHFDDDDDFGAGGAYSEPEPAAGRHAEETAAGAAPEPPPQPFGASVLPREAAGAGPLTHKKMTIDERPPGP